MISLIWAMDKNRVIGNANAIPWNMPIDMKRFVALTKGRPVIMGRKTFQSIGKALPNRTNIIVTTDRKFTAHDCIVAHSVDAAIDVAGHDDEIMVIGGADIYRQFLPRAERLYITIIEHEFDGDAHFPEFDIDEWIEIEKEKHAADDKNKFDCTFLTYQRKKNIHYC